MQQFDEERETAARSIAGQGFPGSDPAPPAGEPGPAAAEERETRWSARLEPEAAPAAEPPRQEALPAEAPRQEAALAEATPRREEPPAESGWTESERGTKVRGGAAEALESVAWLYCLKGEGRGQLYQFRKRRTELGRAADCDVVIEDAYASAHHGAVLFDGGAWNLCDFASSNGTFVNGKRLGGEAQNPFELQDGDSIVIGETELVFKRI